jgi:nucleoside-diphosphate kinase
MQEELLFLLKPDAVVRRYVGARTMKTLIDMGLEVIHFEQLSVTKDFLANKHYPHIRGRSFFDWTINFMSSTPLQAAIIKGEDAISKIRAVLGSTIVQKADKGTIRERYGIYAGVNVAHSSDSQESANREISLWRPLMKTSDINANKSVTDFISKYINFPMIDSLRYREVSEGIVEKKITSDEGKAIFSKFLKIESDLSENTLTNIAQELVNNCYIPR